MTEINVLKQASLELKAAKEKARAVIKEHGAKAIGSAFQEVLINCPNVAVTWKQFAPSFNDGSPCYFRVRDMWVVPADTVPNYAGESDAIDESNLEEYDVSQEQINELYAVFSSVDEWILEETFGSSANIFITSDRIIVDEFYCDDY
jgi:1-acyl-sn-glycerol-3-phosphate acyltransferase